MAPTWIEELSSLSGKEPGPLVATLATVQTASAGPVPQARSVVIRQITDAGELIFTSDARSEKTIELAANPQVALVIWLAGPRTQFRIAGTVRFVPRNGTDRSEVWKKLSDSSRATFLWPPPGAVRQAEDVFETKVGPDRVPPESFDVWTVEPDRVDTLDLRPHPHLRKRWTRPTAGWQSTVINP